MQAVDHRLLGFINHLRREGYTIGVRETLDMLQALDLAAAPEENYTRHALRSLTCRDHHEWLRFDELFSNYWFPERTEPGTKDTVAPPARQRQRRSGGIAGIAGSSRDYEDAIRNLGGILGAGAGRQQTITRADFRFLQDRSAAREAERLAERLADLWRRRLKRRYFISRHGKKIDMRRTLRGNLKFGGLPVNPM